MGRFLHSSLFRPAFFRHRLLGDWLLYGRFLNDRFLQDGLLGGRFLNDRFLRDRLLRRRFLHRRLLGNRFLRRRFLDNRLLCRRLPLPNRFLWRNCLFRGTCFGSNLLVCGRDLRGFWSLRRAFFHRGNLYTNPFRHFYLADGNRFECLHFFNLLRRHARGLCSNLGLTFALFLVIPIQKSIAGFTRNKEFHCLHINHGLFGKNQSTSSAGLPTNRSDCLTLSALQQDLKSTQQERIELLRNTVSFFFQDGYVVEATTGLPPIAECTKTIRDGLKGIKPFELRFHR